MTGAIPVHSWLRQQALALEFGVSRTPIREALRSLQANGIVELVPQRGALVRGPTTRDIREAYVVRAELEGLAAELATEWIRDEQLADLRRAEELFRRSVRNMINASGRARGQSSDDWLRANDMFHSVIQNSAQNERLIDAIAHVHRSFPRNLTYSALNAHTRLLEENVDQHHDILEAVKRRDAAAARQAMTSHIQRAGELVAAWFERSTVS